MKKADLKIIRGGRRELEMKLLRAVFSPDGKKTVAELKKRLARRGKGQLQAVNPAAPAKRGSSPSGHKNRGKDNL